MKKLILTLLLPAVLFSAPTAPDRDKTVIVPSLKGLVFVSNPAAVKKSGLTTSGISLSEVPLLNHPAFQQELGAYIGKPLTFKALNEITSKVSAFYKQQNHPLVNVVAPEQDVTTGVIQIVVTEFRVGEVRADGNRWFSDKVVTSAISLQHGDTIDTQKLLSQLDTANANPFRRVDLVYQPSSTPGYTDLVLNTKDRFPVTVYTGFDNSGTAVTGRSRWNMGATWGNALWHDQQLSYQFSGSDNFFTGNDTGGASFLSNSLSWSMPVRANDSLTIFGSYQKSVPNVGADFGFVGRSGQASIRYNYGLHRTSHFVETLQFGYDFKTTNNNLSFGGTQVSRNSAEIDQFPLTYAANLSDRRGTSSFSTSLVFSPGAITPNNNTDAFQPQFGQSGIPGASAHYFYWRSDFTRLNKLPKNAVYSLRLIGQTSSSNLLYTEKLSAGGPDLLRGYDPNSIYGDRGLVISNELRTPALSPWPEHSLGQAQFYIFWDYGHLMAVQSFAGASNSVNASSVGTGVRYNLRSNLTSHVDYGRALIQLPSNNAAARNSFVDVALTMAY
jgi:hemolysin activation/secretion protein